MVILISHFVMALLALDPDLGAMPLTHGRVMNMPDSMVKMYIEYSRIMKRNMRKYLLN